MKCPTAEEILLARHAEVDPRRQREISRHVARCARCRREDAALRQASAAFAHRFGVSGRSLGPSRHAARLLTPGTLLLTVLVALLITIATIRVGGAIRQEFPPLPPSGGALDDCETPAPAVGATPSAPATPITLTRH